MEILFSLLIPSRNRPEMLRRCLESFYSLAFTPQKVEALVMVDLDDKTNRWLLDASFPNIRIVYQQRSVMLSEDYINLAAKMARGKYLFVLNDDTEMITSTWDYMLWVKIEDYLHNRPDRVCMVSIDDDTHFSWGKEDEIGPCFPILTRETVAALGCFFDGSICCWGADQALWQVFRGLSEGRVIKVGECKLRHWCRHNGRVVADETQLKVAEVSAAKDRLTAEEVLMHIKRLQLALSR